MPVATMKGRSRRIRLSPNEEARILREEKERRRKIRLQQVRDQAKVNASKIRDAVKEEKAYQVSLLAAEIKNEWELEKTEKLRKLNEHHLNSLQHVGDAHVNAAGQVPREIEDALIAQQNLQKATQRHLEAIRKMKEKKEEEELEAKRHITARKFALSQEKERAAIVAAMPPPTSDPLEEVDIPRVRPIKLTDMNAFSLTHYHLPSEEYAVERARTPEQADAKAAAKEEQERIDQLEEDERIAAHGRFEKAQLRHKHARKKEVLKQDYNAMLLDLSDLRRSDISRRQQNVAKIPRSVYQAPHRRQEEKEDEQREMEAVFEDMYMAATDHHGDLTLALDRHPPLSDGSSTTMDVSVDPTTSHQESKGRALPLKDLTNLSVQSLQSLAKSNDSGLSRLMQRIQRQREAWVDRPSQGGVAIGYLAQEASQQKRPIPPDAESSLTTTPTMTQYTITSDDITKTSSKASTLDDTSSVSTGTMSKVSSIKSSVSSMPTITTVTSSDVSTTTLDTIEEGTVTSTSLSQDAHYPRLDTSDTLLHPLEIAAKVRQRSWGAKQKPTSTLVEHLFPADPSQVADRPKPKSLQLEDFRLEQQKLEKDRQEIERKIKDLERQKMMMPAARVEGFFPNEPVGKTVDSGPPAITFPQDGNVPETTYGHLITDYLKKQEFSKPEDKISSITKDLKAMTDSHGIIPSEPVDKVQLYKQRALERYKEKNRQSNTATTEPCDTTVPTQDRTRSETLDTFSRSFKGLGQFHDVSSLTRSASDRASPIQITSPDFSLPTTMNSMSPKSKASPPSQPRPVPANAGAPNRDTLGDVTEYDDIQGKPFVTRHSQLKAQLAEIERQKKEIHERQQQHRNEMTELKTRWQQELQQYSLTDSLIAESLNLSMARTKSELEVELSRSQHSDKSLDGTREEEMDTEGNLEFTSKAIENKVDKRGKGPKVISLPNKSPHIAHDLSTIQEMDTPLTDKKQPGFTSRPLNSTELSQLPDKLPDKPAVRALFVDMYSNKGPHSPKALGTLHEDDYKEVYMPGVTRVDPSPHSPGFASEHPANRSWNVPSWMDYQPKDDFSPSVDRVQQIERVHRTTPGELVLTDKVTGVQGGEQAQPDSTAFSASMSTGPIQDESDVNPDSMPPAVSFTKKPLEVEGSEKSKPFTYSSYLRGEDKHESKEKVNVPLPTGSYLKESENKGPEGTKGPKSLASYIKDLDNSGEFPKLSPRPFQVRSYLRDDNSQEGHLKVSGPLPTGSYLRNDDHDEKDANYKDPLPTGSYLRYDVTPEKRRDHSSLPVGSYLQSELDKVDASKLDPNQINLSYLTPPKMTPTRSTDKIVRCVTTRAFGCERPIKWRGMKKTVEEEAPAEPLIPVNRVLDEREGVNAPEIVKDPPPPPSAIKAMFERSSHETKEAFSIPDSASPIPRDKRASRGFSGQQAQFLSSTPSSVKATSRLDKNEDKTAVQTPTDISTGRLSESHLSSGKLKDETSMMSQMSQYTLSQTSAGRRSMVDDLSTGEKSKISEISQYTLDSEGRRSKTPANLSANTTGLQQGRLTLSGMSSSLMSQHALEESSAFPDSKNQSSMFTPFHTHDSQSSATSKFFLPMDTSKSSQGSSLSQGPRSFMEGQGPVPNQGQYGNFSHSMFSQPSNVGPMYNPAAQIRPNVGARTGPSAEVVDLASNISERAEAAMLKYDRLMEESRRLREQYEAEERVLMTETGSSDTQSNETTRRVETKPSEANMSRSLEQIAAEETGISDEPDLTLVSAASTPQKSPEQSGKSSGSKEQGPLTASGNSNKTDQPGSLLSFEQHEQSLATMSQISLIHPSASDDKTSTISAVSSLPSDSELITPYASTSSTMSRTGKYLASSGADGAEQGESTGSRTGSKPSTGSRSHLSKTIASWKKNNALQSQNTTSATAVVASAGKVVDTSSEDRKKKEKEMKERTERLYSRLEDVKKDRTDRERKEEYAKNRQRQQEYQKNYQEQLRKKMQSKK